MKKVAMKQWLEDAQEHLSKEHLNNETGIFCREEIGDKIDPHTVEVLHRRLEIYLSTWVRPLLEKSISELNKNIRR